MRWRPKATPGVETGKLHLSPLEAHVLQRLDGQHEVDHLPGVTGLGQDRVEEILGRLVQVGAVTAPEGNDGTDPAATAGSPDELAELLDDATTEDLDIPVHRGDHEAEETDAPLQASVDAMAIYVAEFASRPVEERIELAREAVAPQLSALCFDPSARVIAALLTNTRTGLAQARLIARHHRDAAGLEHLLANLAFARDEAVRRELLRNPQLQVPMLRRLWGPRRAIELWRLCTSREATELARTTLKELFRARFVAGEAEERVEVILKTEGRCLLALTTAPVDGRTVAMLCLRTYTSTLLVQNLARWGASPPMLLAHLLKQAIVRRSPPLRSLLLQHPNAPATT
jgi:hypothetical protein